MTEDYTYNDSRNSDFSAGFEKIIAYPLPPMNTPSTRFDMEVYAKFMRHLRELRMESDALKILSAILFTAKAMDTSDALVSKVLVDMGLRAPRRAFPISFVEFVDQTMERAGWREGAASSSVVELCDCWRHMDGHNIESGLVRIDEIVGAVRTNAERRHHEQSK